MRLLITGGSGYLGQHLVPQARSAGHDVTYSYFSADPLQLPHGLACDLRDRHAVQNLVRAIQPEAIIHTAGSNRTPDMSNVIIEGTRHLVESAPNLRFIHLSTDVLFDGKQAPYDESAEPSPLHPYGQAKALAERIVQNHPNHVIVRTSLIYGRQKMDMGTLWMREALQKGEPVTLFRNHWRNPVRVEQLAQACLELLQHNHQGKLNVAGAQYLTRVDFALKMLAYWGISAEKIAIADDLSGRFPLDCRLIIDKARTILQTPLSGVDDGD